MIKQKKIKGAIIGYGFISSKGHMPAYSERLEKSNDVEIVAICDICQERELDIPAGVKFYNNYQDLFFKELDNLDFLDISTHAADHYKIAKFGLENGLHVLCEKPLTTSAEQALDLIKTAINYKRVLFPCHNYKHAPVVTCVRDIIKSGKIGNVKAITLNTFRNTHAIGTKEWIPNWRRYSEYSGGGIAMDHGSHGLYLIFEWLGGYPKSVTANTQNFSFPKYDTEDNFSAVFEFDSGIANIHLSWTAGIRKVIYVLQGDKGAIRIEDDSVEVAVINSNETEMNSHKATWDTEKFSIKSNWMDSSHTSWFNSMFDQFKKAIDQNDYENTEIVDAYFCIHSIMKAYESTNKNSIKLLMENNFSNIKNDGGIS